MAFEGRGLAYKETTADGKAKRALSVLLKPEACLAEAVRGKKEVNILDFGCGIMVYAGGFLDFFMRAVGDAKINLVLVDAGKAKMPTRLKPILESRPVQCTIVEDLVVVDKQDIPELQTRSGIERFDIITMFNPKAPHEVTTQLHIGLASEEFGIVKNEQMLRSTGRCPDRVRAEARRRTYDKLVGYVTGPISSVFKVLLTKDGLLFIAAASDSLPFEEIRAALRTGGYNIRIDEPNLTETDPGETFNRHLFVANFNGDNTDHRK